MTDADDPKKPPPEPEPSPSVVVSEQRLSDVRVKLRERAVKVAKRYGRG